MLPLKMVCHSSLHDFHHADNSIGPYVYDLGFQFDRSKAIRSHTGYVGLRNLSNTCYLNSLFTQLFMNIPFREFMLNAHVADGGASQKLLSETQNLFSYMQNSYRRFVDPTNLANSIRTYEETQIDVTIQMDVDEFYNLLFDRWESQILAPEAKRKFRSFYGGQLVQQVKSKECSHISERLEPFSAIQCDIKGKSSLQESLQAYVDGEVMEGGKTAP
jgi:ubiquitin carboxyl-terminal hydrolase 34